VQCEGRRGGNGQTSRSACRDSEPRGCICGRLQRRAPFQLNGGYWRYRHWAGGKESRTGARETCAGANVGDGYCWSRGDAGCQSSGIPQCSQFQRRYYDSRPHPQSHRHGCEPTLARTTCPAIGRSPNNAICATGRHPRQHWSTPSCALKHL
jgi:hypothetical protein